MNKEVADACAEAELKDLSLLSFDELKNFIKRPLCKFVAGLDGKTYQLEISAVWDTGNENGVLRIFVMVDDGGWSSFFPLTRSYLRSPAVQTRQPNAER